MITPKVSSPSSIAKAALPLVWTVSPTTVRHTHSSSLVSSGVPLSPPRVSRNVDPGHGVTTGVERSWRKSQSGLISLENRPMIAAASSFSTNWVATDRASCGLTAVSRRETSSSASSGPPASLTCATAASVACEIPGWRKSHWPLSDAGCPNVIVSGASLPPPLPPPSLPSPSPPNPTQPERPVIPAAPATVMN